jgi:hypothetical protein
VLGEIGADLSSVPVVILAPSRNRDTSLPSLTTAARRSIRGLVSRRSADLAGICSAVG